MCFFLHLHLLALIAQKEVLSNVIFRAKHCEFSQSLTQFSFGEETTLICIPCFVPIPTFAVIVGRQNYDPIADYLFTLNYVSRALNWRPSGAGAKGLLFWTCAFWNWLSSFELKVSFTRSHWRNLIVFTLPKISNLLFSYEGETSSITRKGGTTSDEKILNFKT